MTSQRILLTRLGKRVKQARQSRSISQEALAELAGFDRTYISMIERGKRNPSLLNLSRLAAALQLDLSELLKDIENG